MCPAGRTGRITYRRDIDGLRAVAVLAVLLGHADVPGFTGGYVGVDIFFVISGFLIGSILLKEMDNGEFSLLQFYERRARRILPALFAVILFCMIFGWFLFPPPQYESFGWSAIAAIFFASNFYFHHASTDYFAGNAEYEPLLHTWSLGVEEQFYILFPLFLLLLYPKSKRAFVVVLAAGVALSFAASAYAAFNHPVAGFYMSPTRAWELGVGVMLALIRSPQHISKLAAEVIAATGLISIALAIFLFDKDTPFPGFAGLLPVLGSAAIIYAGISQKPWVSSLLSAKLMVGVGLISYSLYLWHWPALVVARGYSNSGSIGLMPSVIAMLFAFTAACLSWRYIERPFRGNGKPAFSRKQIFWCSGIGSAALAGVGLLIAVSQGFWNRSPELLAPYKKAAVRSQTELACSRAMKAGQCRIGSDEKSVLPTVFLFGDSHAAALIPGLDAELRERGLSAEVSTKPGCAPVAEVVRTDVQGKHDCPGFNLRTVDRIVEQDNIRTVILAGRWPLWATGSRYEKEAGGTPVMAGQTERSRRYGEDNAQLLEAGLETIVAKLVSSNRRVVILSGVPEIGWDVPKNWLSTFYLGNTLQSGPTLDQVRQRHAPADQALKRIAAKYPVTVIDVPAAFCDERCLVSLDGELLYRDDDHLSEAAARLLFAKFGQEIISSEVEGK